MPRRSEICRNDDELPCTPVAPLSWSAGASAVTTTVATAGALPAATAASPTEAARPPSFAAHLAVKSLQQDALRLLALAAFALLGVVRALAVRDWGRALCAGAAQAGLPLACLAALIRAPAAYRRQADIAALLMHALLLAGGEVAAMQSSGTFFDGVLDRDGLAGTIAWLGCFLALSGACSGMLVSRAAAAIPHPCIWGPASTLSAQRLAGTLQTAPGSRAVWLAGGLQVPRAPRWALYRARPCVCAQHPACGLGQGGVRAQPWSRGRASPCPARTPLFLGVRNLSLEGVLQQGTERPLGFMPGRAPVRATVPCALLPLCAAGSVGLQLGVQTGHCSACQPRSGTLPAGTQNSHLLPVSHSPPPAAAPAALPAAPRKHGSRQPCLGGCQLS